MRGIWVDVYRSKHDATNGGVTSPKREARSYILMGVERGNIEEGDIREGDVVFELVRRKIYGEEYIHAVPRGEKRPTMFGGNFIFTSDSRFPNAYPIAVHDRVEG